MISSQCLQHYPATNRSWHFEMFRSGRLRQICNSQEQTWKSTDLQDCQVLDKLLPVGSQNSWREKGISLLGWEAGDTDPAGLNAWSFCSASLWLFFSNWHRIFFFPVSRLLWSMLAVYFCFCTSKPWVLLLLFLISSYKWHRQARKNRLMPYLYRVF